MQYFHPDVERAQALAAGASPTDASLIAEAAHRAQRQAEVLGYMGPDPRLEYLRALANGATKSAASRVRDVAARQQSQAEFRLDNARIDAKMAARAPTHAGTPADDGMVDRFPTTLAWVLLHRRAGFSGTDGAFRRTYRARATAHAVIRGVVTAVALLPVWALCGLTWPNAAKAMAFLLLAVTPATVWLSLLVYLLKPVQDYEENLQARANVAPSDPSTPEP